MAASYLLSHAAGQEHWRESLSLFGESSTKATTLMKKTFLAALTILLASNFAARAGWLYSEYSGTYREWPTTAESMAETGHKVPVFRTWPTKPYEVLGSLRHDNPNQEWRNGEINDAANEAKKKKGNAIIIRFGSEDAVMALSGVSGQANLFRAQMTALVIRFLSDEEVATRDQRRRVLFKDVLRSNPGVNFSEDTGVLAIKYLLQSGVKETSTDFQSIFVDTMNRVRPQKLGDISGEWIFKATLKTSSLTTSDERSFFGIASVMNDGTNLVVMSKQGNVEFNYSGRLAGGKLDGQLGIGGISTKSEGVLLDDKISLTYQSLTGAWARWRITLPCAVPEPVKDW